MSELDWIYQRILMCGLVSVRKALRLGEHEYCKCEIEHLHELPTLIGDENILRHRYYATGTRELYKRCLIMIDSTFARDHIETAYVGYWKALDRILENEGA
ncbi:hypothetical protein V5E97_05940 [Singulisphaera sp. Ch08]|uniref:Uncharacterized protein n=1 Tax=Singulisphaera sp. Ch08 TaxID=3120278 RepID=A0AAU7CKJ9_9BACT